MLKARASLTTLQRIERANIELLGHPATVSYAGVIMVGEYRVDPNVPTAYTDGINCVYGDAFMQTLTEAETRAVIMHETLHKTFQHLFLWKHLAEKNAQVTNMALDFVINLIIKDIDTATQGFIRLPKGALLDERFRDMDSQQVFNILLDEAEKQWKSGKGKPGGPGQEPMDIHDWAKAKGLSDEEAKTIAKEIDQAIRQGQLLATKMNGDVPRELAELTKVKEDWREQLSEFLVSSKTNGDISSYRKINRRWLQYDMYMPTTYDDSMGELVVAVDLSGSISAEDYNKFISHIVSICTNTQPEKLHVIFWDTRVTKHCVYLREDLDTLVNTLKPKGGGGTDVACIFNYIDTHKIQPLVIAVLTDGYTDYPERYRVPVIWAMTTDVIAPWGRNICIKD